MSYFLTIASVIKDPATGFEKTRRSVLREFSDVADVEFLIKEWNKESNAHVHHSDKSPEIIGKLHCRHINSSDSGVFDGMNQAIGMAQGEWLVFLNAGDWFVEGFAKALRKAAQEHPRTDFFYFDGITVDSTDGREFLRVAPDALRMKDFLQRAPVLHPCLVVRRSILQNLRFNTQYDLAADFDLLVRLVSSAYRGVRIATPGAFILSGGLSEQKRIRARRQAMRSLLRHGSGNGFKTRVRLEFLRFLILHAIITYLVRPFPFLRNYLRGCTGGRAKGTFR